MLYAGTDRGVFVSFDDGAHWRSLQHNLPSAIVTDLLVHERNLVVSTLGRGIGVLDDLSPLRQAGAVEPEVLCSLHNDLEGSDAAPTESQRQVLSASDERLNRALALCQETRGPALARLNDALEGAGLPPIAIPPVEQIHPGEAIPGRDLP